MCRSFRRFGRLGARLGRVAGTACVASALFAYSALALEASVPEKTAPAKPASLASRIEAAGFTRGAPIYFRIFKAEAVLEVWMRKGDRFELFNTYPVCKYDGTLGPKLYEGDRQSPEGFYTVSPAQLRWTGRWYRGFDLSFPNAYDEDQGRTGSAILIHGGCASIGCYAMTNAVVDELFEIATEAFDGGQTRIAVHVYPFRMTDENMARHSQEAWASFWERLKPAYDHFETDRVPPRVSVCKGEYRIEAGAAGYAGNEPVARTCATAPTVATATTAIALPDTAKGTGFGPLRAYLEEVRKQTPIALYPGATKASKSGKHRIAGGVPIRCNLRLPSCRKWAALHRRAKPKAARAASVKKRRTASATP
jgi:murein L,D-transpeptidase YafK